MQFVQEINRCLTRRALALAGLALLAGCAGQSVQPSEKDYVEIDNPGITSSPNAPATIWVPRSYVEKGVPRGGELAKRSYEAVTGTGAHPAQRAAATAPTTTAPQMAAPTMPAPIVATPGNITGTGGKPAHLIPHFGLIAAVEGEKVFFNLGRESGIAPGQKLKVYRGGTVIEGLGLAPGENVATVEVVGFVGTRGGYGVIRQGGPVQANDLIGAE